MFSRILAFRTLLLLLLAGAFGLSAPAWAQDAAAKVGSAGASAVSGTASTTAPRKFIPTPKPTAAYLALRNRPFQGRAVQPSLLPGVNVKPSVQIGKPPRVIQKKADLSFSGILTGFHAADGPNPYIPPDPTMAAGYNDLVVASNDGWAIYDKSGNQTYSVNFNTWFGDSADQFSDPHVVFDPWTGYYYMVVLEINMTNNTAAWVIDVSPQGTASGSHRYFFLNARLTGGTDANQWMDYPYIGYSANAVYLTGSMISFSSGNFIYDQIRILKPSELDAASGGVSWWDMWNLQSNGNVDFDISPAQQLTNEGVEYLVNAQGGGGNYLTLRRITNETDFTNGPQLSTEVIGVGQYNAPQPAVQPNGTQGLEAGDCRVGMATMQFGRLNVIGSTNVNFGNGARDAAKIYRLLVDSGAPSTVDRDTNYGFTDLDIFYPAITGTVDNDQLLTFDYSGTGTDPSIAIAGWGNTEGGVDQALQTKGGEGDYFQDFGSGRNRWGDFSAICLDPNNYRNVWSTSEYAGTGSTASNGLWSTWVNQFNILPAGVVSVAAVSGSVGQTVTLSANLSNEQTSAAIAGETLDFQVDGVDLGTATTDGSGNASVSYAIGEIGAGGHTIAVYFAGDSSYNPGSGSNTLTVYTADSTFIPQDAAGTIGGITNLEAYLYRVSDFASIIGRTVYFTVDGNAVGSAVTDGGGQAYMLYVLPASLSRGTHSIGFTFAGDGDYNASSSTGTLYAYANTTLKGSNAAGGIGQKVNLAATLTVTAGGAKVAGETVSFLVDGTNVGTGVTNSGGTAIFAYTIPSGTTIGSHALSFSYGGSSTTYFNGSSGSSTLTVSKAGTVLSVSNVSGGPGQTVNLKAVLKQTTNGAVLSGETVTFKVGTTTVGTATTDGTGTATKAYLIPTSASGTETITASYAGDANTNASTGTGTLTIAKPATAITVAAVSGAPGQSVTLSATLKAGSVLLNNKTLTFKVDSTTVGTAVTNASGVATKTFAIPAAEAAGAHTITVSFAGDTSDGASTGTGTLTVTKAATTLTVLNVTGAQGQTITLTGTLKAGSVSLSGKTLTFKVDSTTVGTAVTNSSGVATKAFVISNALAIGSHTITVTFAGDTSDTASTGTGTLTVAKANTVLAVPAVTGTHGTTVTLTATLTRTTDNTGLSGKSVLFKVGSATAGTGVTNSSGVASVSYLIPASTAPGTLTISVTFAGDAGYYGHSGTGTLTVK